VGGGLRGFWNESIDDFFRDVRGDFWGG
jgi:hypothetical protein